ncbi:MAG: hypothetical protein AB7G25_13650 [Sphingomonadaceae bacterium]
MTASMDKRGPQHGHRGGGALIAICTLVGTGIGISMGQPSIGILSGAGLGTVLALVLWLRDRKP